jgi:hypothetical protein
LVSAIFAQKNVEAACRELRVLSELATRRSSLRKVLTIAVPIAAVGPESKQI